MDRRPGTALTPVEVAEMLRITRNTVYELIKRGELRGYRVGKKVRVDREDVEAYKRRGLPASLQAVQRPTEAAPRGNFVIAGQDLMLDVLVQQAERAFPGFQPFRSHLGSYNGLFALYQGQVDAATAHLWDEETGTYNAPFVKRMLPGIPAVLIHLSRRPVGLYVRTGTPRGISGWRDFSRADIVMMNRELGSGMRVLIDEKLRLLGLDARAIPGYRSVASSHLAAATAVARGDADVAVGNEKACRQVPGVDFIFLHDESLDMVTASATLEDPGMLKILSVLRSAEFRAEIDCLGGYDLTDLGREIG
jgi:putative molybdopterin biosynthesis protein